MKRVLEPQLIDDKNSVKVLCESFSEKEADLFIENINQHFPYMDFSECLDFCCGTGDFAIVLAKKKKGNIDAIDGSAPVLNVAKEKIKNADLSSRISVKHLYAPFVIDKKYDFIYSLNSLHHFHEPKDFWLTIKNHTRKGSKVLVIDLHRPPSEETAKEIVNTYEAVESSWHQKEAYNSLLASFEASEVVKQLEESNFNLNVATIKTKFEGFSFIVVWGEV